MEVRESREPDEALKYQSKQAPLPEWLLHSQTSADDSGQDSYRYANRVP